MLKYMPPSGLAKERPCLPRPAVCSWVAIRAPCGAPCKAHALASVLVEAVWGGVCRGVFGSSDCKDVEKVSGFNIGGLAVCFLLGGLVM